jgi:hypothetical protein
VAMGNALRVGEDAGVRAALGARSGHADEVVRETVGWAIDQRPSR